MDTHWAASMAASLVSLMVGLKDVKMVVSLVSQRVVPSAGSMVANLVAS